MFKKIIFGMSLLALVMISCKKENLPPNNGIYRGVFSRIIDNGADTSGTGVVHLSLHEDTWTYRMKGDTQSLAPFSCQGLFGFPDEGNNLIQFVNTSAVDPEMEDPYYILDTVFRYNFTDSIFRFELRIDEVKYDYHLWRI